MSKLKSIAIAISLLLMTLNVLAGTSGSGNQDTSADPVIANSPPLPSQIRLWEAWAKGFATVYQTSNAGHTITNFGPVSIIVDERIMMMSPSPANPSEDVPGVDDEAQDGVLTQTYTVPAGGSLDYNYGDNVLLQGHPPPPWWCTEDSEYTYPVQITLGGEILPYDLWDEVDNPDDTVVMYSGFYTTATQAAVWSYIRANPTLLIGKLPLWKEIGNIGDEVDITLDITNIGFQTASGVVVTDRIPSGYSYDPSSFTRAPSAIVNNPDGSITLRWNIQSIAAAVETPPFEPTDYTTVNIGYKLLTPILDPDIRIFLPRAYADRDGNGINDAESEEPLLETYLVNRPPVAIVDDVTVLEGETAILDGSQSYDPDETIGDSIVSYEWDTDGDGIVDAYGPTLGLTYGDNGIYTVTLKVTDSYGWSSMDSANVTVNNAAPGGKELLVNGKFSDGLNGWSHAVYGYTPARPPLPSSKHFTSTGNGYLETKVEDGYNEVLQAVEVTSLCLDFSARLRAVDFSSAGGLVSVSVWMFNDQPPGWEGNPPNSANASIMYDMLLGRITWYFRSDYVYPSDETTYNVFLGNAPSGWHTIDVNIRDVVNAHLPGVDESEVKWLWVMTNTYGESGGFTVGYYDDLSLIVPMLCGPFTVNEGSPISITASAQDSGSDDLEFSWQFELGPTFTNDYYNAGPGNPEPVYNPGTNEVKSPGGAFPFAQTDTVTHTYGDNGVYLITLTVTDDDGGSTTESVPVIVGNVDPAITGAISASMDLDLGIRVAGSKWSNVMLELVDDDGNSVQLLEVERWPGDPDKNPSVGISSVTLDMTKSYKAVVTYDPFPDDGDAIEGDQGNNGKDKKDNAGNPVWLTIEFKDGTLVTLHHTFNTEQSKHRGSDHWNHVDPWIVELAPYLVGHEFELSAEASDVGSDDLTFDWSCGVQNIHYNDDTGPDPFPSPDGIYPFSAEDEVACTYTGPETIILTVYDDDGGTALASIDIA